MSTHSTCCCATFRRRPTIQSRCQHCQHGDGQSSLRSASRSVRCFLRGASATVMRRPRCKACHRLAIAACKIRQGLHAL